jgi:hypothetical protein
MHRARQLATLLEALRVPDATLVSVRTDRAATLFPAGQTSRYRATSPTVNMEVTPVEASTLLDAGALAKVS